jgi:hypothetical protein
MGLFVSNALPKPLRSAIDELANEGANPKRSPSKSMLADLQKQVEQLSEKSAAPE